MPVSPPAHLLEQRGSGVAGAGAEVSLSPHDPGFLQGRLSLLTLAPAARHFSKATLSHAENSLGARRGSPSLGEPPPPRSVQVVLRDTGSSGGPGQCHGLLSDKELGLHVGMATRHLY